jgi:hypothetical protein
MWLKMTDARNIKNPKNLYCDTVDVKPIYFDFGKGYMETWEVPLNLTEQEQENEEFSPMMNYYYPLPNLFVHDMKTLFGEDWATKIKKQLSNTTLIYFLNDETYALALTGGGMDFSWEICESFINLGYLPPFHFCELPNMAGIQYNTAKVKRIIRACKRSCDIMTMRATRTKKHIKSLHNYSTNQPKEQT